MKRSLFRTLIACGLTTLVGFSSAQAQDDNFYEGKTVTLMVGYSAGGGYDTYGRTLARHIGKHIPGNPDVVVKNVPGAGSLVLTNQVANTVERDGTVFATIGRGMAFEPLFGSEQAQFEPGELNWIGSLNNETSICVSWHESGIDTWQDLKEKTMTVGGTGAGADTDLFPRVLADIFGFKLNVISGYPGGNDILLAMERGEVMGRCGWSWSSAKSRRADWFADLTDGSDEDQVNILFQMSLKKHSDLPDVPLVTEFAETRKQRQVLNLLFARQVMGRPYVAPPGVPAERIAILREAMAKTAEDPEFLEDARNQALGINFVGGEEVQSIVLEAYESPKEVIDLVMNAK